MTNFNISSIIAFFNQIAADVGLEDCHTVKELRILVPIVLNYMDSGVLSFVDNPSFTFADTVKRIVEEMDDPFHSLLDAEAAEREDERRRQIHLALLYTFRLVQKDLFALVCEKLSPEHHNRIADMVGLLDERKRWTNFQWPQMLQMQPTGMELFKDNSKTPDRDRSRAFYSTLLSPIANVMESPRGQEVELIHMLYQALRKLERRNEELEGRLTQMLPDAERLSFLTDKQLEMEAEIATLTKRLREADGNANSAVQCFGAIQFELRQAVLHLEVKQRDLEWLQDELEKADRRLRDKIEMHEETRKKLRKVESQLAAREPASRLEHLEGPRLEKEPKRTCVDLMKYLDKNAEPLLIQEGVIRPALKPKPAPNPKPLNLPARPAGSALNGPPKSTAKPPPKKSEEADLIDLTNEFAVEEEHPALDWGELVSAENPANHRAAPATISSGGRTAAADVSGGRLLLQERVSMVLEALRNLLMMNPDLGDFLVE